MTTSRTERGDFLFKVSEFADGTPWISLEPRTSNPELRKVLVGFDLKPGSDTHHAETVARFLNDNLGNVTFTFVDGARIGS